MGFWTQDRSRGPFSNWISIKKLIRWLLSRTFSPFPSPSTLFLASSYVHLVHFALLLLNEVYALVHLLHANKGTQQHFQLISYAACYNSYVWSESSQQRSKWYTFTFISIGDLLHTVIYIFTDLNSINYSITSTPNTDCRIYSKASGKSSWWRQ